MFLRITIILLSIFALPMTGMAASGENSPLYIGVNGAKFKITTTDVAGVETSESYDGFMANLGYDFNNYFAIEAMAGASSSADDAATGSSSKVDYTAGIYLRANLRFDHVTLAFLLGQSTTDITTTTGSTSTSTSESGTSSGIALDFYGTRDLAVSFRTMVLFSKNNPGGGDTTMTMSTFGITYYFDTPKLRSRY